MLNLIVKVIFILQGIVYISGRKLELDILEIQWNTTTPEAVNMHLRAVQPQRGIFGLSGTAEFTEDFDTEVHKAQVKVYYSSNGISYQLSPFRVPEQPMITAMNGPYKQYLMEDLSKCCENAPEAQSFSTPMTKRLIVCENCIFNTDSLPPTLRPGYYRIVIMLYNHYDFTVSALIRIDVA